MIRTLWVAASWPPRIGALRRALGRRSAWLERLLGHGRAAWRRRWLGLGAAWLVCLTGWAGVLLPPSHYRSSALLFADPGPGLALASHANGRTAATLAVLQRALASPAGLARVAAAQPLPAAAEPAAAAVGRVGALASRITITIEAPALFRVSYEAEQPDTAQRALQTLVELVTADRQPPVLATGPGAVDERAAGLQASRDRAAGLRNDLATALMQRDARARQLAEVPPVLVAGRPNPVYEQIALQLGQQETLIAGLRGQLAATEAESARLEQQRAVGSEAEALAPATLGDRPDRPRFRLVDPPGWPSAPEGAPRPLLLAAILTVGVAVGTTAAAWRAQRDGAIDDAAQLERRFQLPVLGTIATPAPAGQDRGRQRARAAFGFACLGLLGLFGGLVAAEALDLLAPLAERLRVAEAG